MYLYLKITSAMPDVYNIAPVWYQGKFFGVLGLELSPFNGLTNPPGLCYPC